MLTGFSEVTWRQPLKKAADAMLALPGMDEKKRQELAKFLQSQSPYYQKYAPVVEAIRE